MEETYEVYFRDPHQIFMNMLANPTFAQDFDYTPMQQFNTNGSRPYQHFMSGDWAWKQAVGLCSVCHSHFTNPHTTGRTSSQSKFQTQMVLCLLPSLSAAIRPQVSVATGQNEYWLLYASIGNIHNNVRQAHGSGLVCGNSTTRGKHSYWDGYKRVKNECPHSLLIYLYRPKNVPNRTDI